MDETMRIQGDSILHSFRYIQRKKGMKGLEQVVSQLDYKPEDIYPERWYPVDMHLRLLEIADKSFDYKDYPVCSRMGFNRAKEMGFLKSPGKRMDPIEIFERVRDKWLRFSDFGRIELRNVEEGQADIYLCKCPSHPLYCQRMEGFFTGILLEVCKVNEAEVKQIKCASDGEEYCKFEARWK
jgi:hypothetical protein